MNTIGKLAACALIACMSPLAAGQKWTWEAGKQTSNGQITVKSLSGSTTYSGTQNPTGAVAKTNQNAVTQPPTVIIQATGGGGACAAKTRSRYNGNLGGVTGADAKCAAEFGTGWRFADLFSASSCISIGIETTMANTYEIPWYWAGADDAWSCGKWTTNDSGTNGSYLTRQISSGVYSLGPAFRDCSNQWPLLCVKMQ